ncbi:MAG: hypothetical protein NTX53_20575 [candidate division WOR-3 bacterium]|nr:hypothetical protein [candidate division WOR-3 bacterium]
MSAESPSDLAHVRAVQFDLFHTLVSLEVSEPPGPSVSAILGVDRETWWRAWTDNSGDYVLEYFRGHSERLLTHVGVNNKHPIPGSFGTS